MTSRWRSSLFPGYSLATTVLHHHCQSLTRRCGSKGSRLGVKSAYAETILVSSPDPILSRGGARGVGTRLGKIGPIIYLRIISAGRYVTMYQTSFSASVWLHKTLYHDAWADKRHCHHIYSPYTLAQPFIFPYTLGCTVARTTNALAVANGLPTV